MSNLENNDIRDLLDRYWEGQTSIDEERRLKEYFAYGKVSEELESEAAWFRSLVEAPAEGLEDDFDLEILELTKDRSKGKVISFPFIRRYWAAAAAVVILVGLGVWSAWNSFDPNELPGAATVAEQPTEQEIQAAYEQTRQALFMISASMSKGQEQVKELGKFEKATEQVKTINND